MNENTETTRVVCDFKRVAWYVWLVFSIGYFVRAEICVNSIENVLEQLDKIDNKPQNNVKKLLTYALS